MTLARRIVTDWARRLRIARVRMGGLALPVQSAKANPAAVVQVNGESGVPLVPPPGGVAMPQVPMWAYWLVFGGLFVLAVLTWLSRRAKQGEAGGAQRRVGVASTIEAKHGRGAGRDDADREAAALARDLTAELDARADRLERLIAEADQRLEQLAQAQARIGTAASASASAAGAAKTPTAPARPSFVASHAQASDERLEDTTRAILSLADEGLTPVQIAQRLGQHVGKVELILALQRDRTS